MSVNTSLIRPIDLKDKTNLAIIIMTCVFFIIFTGLSMYRGDTLTASAAFGFNRSMAAFLSWAIARELDPDAKTAAFYGVPVIFVLMFFSGPMMVLPCFFILASIRLLTRTSGNAPTNFDLILIMFFSFYLYLFYSFLFPLFGAVYIIIDARLKGGQSRNIIYAGFMLLISLLSFINLYTIERVDTSIILIIAVSMIAAVFSFRLSTLKQVLSRSDNDLYYLSPRRIKAAGIVTLLLSITFAVNYGHILRMSPLWTAMLGIAAPHIKNIKKSGFAGN